ncbi:hypothetical protein [Pseudoduganella sp. LjRoot289]|uniref:hypothetical protein n=1 Tax=Pseudoduganella sp. LjRoot289 TaxID=3342314 RepID=UPI003F4FC3FF
MQYWTPARLTPPKGGLFHAVKRCRWTTRRRISRQIGKIGAGKSTLPRLLLERPDSGSVTVDDHKLAVLNKRELREARSQKKLHECRLDPTPGVEPAFVQVQATSSERVQRPASFRSPGSGLHSCICMP